jgi:S1-C subfamily serine protease
MKPDQSFYELLDNYHKGLLDAEQIAALHAMVKDDVELKKEADAHLEFLNSLEFYGKRKHTIEMLNDIHQGIQIETENEQTAYKLPFWRRNLRVTAVAASVAVIFSVSTFLVMKSFQHEQEADYRALRGNVERMQKSIDNIAKQDVKPSRPGKFSGTGFLISPNGYVVTSHHVIKDADSIIIANEFFGELKAVVVNTDSKNDLALLKIENPGFSLKRRLPFIIKKGSAEMGEYVYTLGFPREDVVFGEGSISASTGFRQDPNAYQISIPLNPGNSGGPLLDSRGDVVGIVSGIQTQTSGTAFAIKSLKLIEFLKQDALDSLRKPLLLPKQNSTKNFNRTDQIKRWKDLVFIVRVYNDR